MEGVPEWAAIVVALIALVGVVITGTITYRTQQQLRRDRRAEVEASRARAEQDAGDAERRDRRDRAVEIYQWAAELAVSPDSRQAQVGVDALTGYWTALCSTRTPSYSSSPRSPARAQPPIKAIEQALDEGVEIRVVQVKLEDLGRLGRSLESRAAARPAVRARIRRAGMVKTVLVTPAQVDAARAVVQRRAETGRPVPEALRRIAEADHDDSGEARSPLEAPTVSASSRPDLAGRGRSAIRSGASAVRGGQRHRLVVALLRRGGCRSERGAAGRRTGSRRRRAVRRSPPSTAPRNRARPR